MHQPKPIPSTPTHCRGCHVELPPLRRYAGLCADCVRRIPLPAATDPTERLWTILDTVVVTRPNGDTERHLRVQCRCGQIRTMSRAAWDARRSTRCRRCRLQLQQPRRA